jgi:hypothetical protein
MIVVSDTSPLNYLVLIEFQDLLPNLFGRILIPTAVDHELRSAAAPDAIKRFMASPPDWLEVHLVSETEREIEHLDLGEREAISLALRVSADVPSSGARPLNESHFPDVRPCRAARTASTGGTCSICEVGKDHDERKENESRHSHQSGVSDVARTLRFHARDGSNGGNEYGETKPCEPRHDERQHTR